MILKLLILFIVILWVQGLGILKECDKVNVIAMNPPYGGSTEASVKNSFPSDMRSSETADLFMVLIMFRLKANGRAAVIVPDGFLFGVDGAKLAIKTKLLKDFNLHTIIRLPGSIFLLIQVLLQIFFFSIMKGLKMLLMGIQQKKLGFIVLICLMDISTSLRQNQ